MNKFRSDLMCKLLVIGNKVNIMDKPDAVFARYLSAELRAVSFSQETQQHWLLLFMVGGVRDYVPCIPDRNLAEDLLTVQLV